MGVGVITGGVTTVGVTTGGVTEGLWCLGGHTLCTGGLVSCLGGHHLGGLVVSFLGGHHLAGFLDPVGVALSPRLLQLLLSPVFLMVKATPLVSAPCLALSPVVLQLHEGTRLL
jgi:hypothetical protein